MNKRGYLNPATGIVIGNTLWYLLLAGGSALLALLIKIFWKPLVNLVKKKKENG